MLRRQRDDLLASVQIERIAADDEPADAMLHHCRERAVDVARASGSQDDELQPDGARRLLQLRRLSRRFRIVRIDQEGDACRIGDHFVQQSQPLGSEFGVEPAHPGDIAARLPDTGDKAAFDRVVS